jgi:hypothetical protein
MGKSMDSATLSGQTAQLMRENFQTTISMDKVPMNGQMAGNISEDGILGRCTEKENILGPRLVIGTRVITLTITGKVMELIIRRKINLIAVFGREEFIKSTSFDHIFLNF